VKRFALTTFFLISGFATAGQLEDQLRAHWQGAWVVVVGDVYSNCNGFFSNNDVQQGRSTSKANHAFRAGELGKIHKIDVKRSRISVFILIEEPILNQRQDGPFTLFNEVSCKAELRFKLGRATIKNADFAAINAVLEKAMHRFQSKSEASRASVYNGRERRPFPEDYEATLAAHSEWQVEQRNLAIERKIVEAQEEVDRILDRLDSDREYATGFVEGIRAMKKKYFGNCEQLIAAQIYQFDTKPSGRITAKYKEGYDDGQHLAFNQEIAHRLRQCLE